MVVVTTFNNKNEKVETSTNNNSEISNTTATDSTENYNDSNPITEITFSLGKTLEDCYDGLKRNNYQVIDGDIRESCGGKYGALGVRKFKDYHGDPITNIIGTISKETQTDSFFILYKRFMRQKTY